MLPGISSSMLLVGAGSGSLTASCSPSSIARVTSASSGVSKALTSGTVTAVVGGASGSVTYAWAFISGDAGISINSASASATSFTATVLADSQKRAIFGCTVTDSTGQTLTPQVTVTLTVMATL